MARTKKVEITPELLEEIKAENRRKLDELMEGGADLIAKLAKEQYGRNWMAVFAGENHPIHRDEKERRAGLRAAGNYKYSHNGYRDRRITKLDMDDNEIATYENVYEAVEAAGLKERQLQEIIACCTGRYKSYKNFKWKFTDEENWDE